MARTASTLLFECSACGAQFSKWTGRCLQCAKWGTLAETHAAKSQPGSIQSSVPALTPVALTEVAKKNVERIKTEIAELDRVLGGGIVPGSLILLGGSPGIGKSTLALQLALAIPQTLYISGEESVEQIKLRADRLSLKNSTLKLVTATELEPVLATIIAEKPALVILDSIQTIASTEVQGEAGSVSQIRACTVRLLEVAKQHHIPMILIGHVTKDGSVSGPKTLEHLVDTVLYFEGDRQHFYRLLRATKNRFGATDEVGVFQMTGSGLVEVKNPSAVFMADRQEATSGSVLTCLMEGTRPLIVEVQALVSKTAFGFPVRKASGFDLNRLHVLLAVLQKRAGLQLEQYDVHVNIVGGIEAEEPAADLAVALAVASSYKEKILGNDLIAFGEVGLGGEVRPVPQTEKRLKECEQLGLKRALIAQQKDALPKGKLHSVPISNLTEIIKHT
jgi:DNA repair protein RadA/Sms